MTLQVAKKHLRADAETTTTTGLIFLPPEIFRDRSQHRKLACKPLTLFARIKDGDDAGRVVEVAIAPEDFDQLFFVAGMAKNIRDGKLGVLES